MPTLDTTVGGSAANSYASLAEYKAYLETRLPAVTWLAAAIAGTMDAALTVDLIAAARLMDASFVWTGQATSAATQALSWPRTGMFNRNGSAILSNVNPIDLKYAQSELAIHVRNTDLMSEDEAAKKGVQRVKAGSVEVEFQQTDVGSQEYINWTVDRLDPSLAWTRIPAAVRDLLVESWYVRASARRVSSFRVY